MLSIRHFSFILACFLCSGLSVSLHSYAQESNPRQIYYNEKEGFMTTPPMKLVFGDQVFIGCDSAFLLNPDRYHVLLRARDFILMMDPQRELEMIVEYEKSLKHWDQSYTDLLAKYNTISGDYSQSLEKNQRDLQALRYQLENAKKEVDKAKVEVIQAKSTLAKSKKGGLRRGIWGGAGLAVGLLLGFIVAQ